MIEETIETARRYVLINDVRELRNTVERACVLRRYPRTLTGADMERVLHPSVAPRTGYSVQARAKTFRSGKRDPEFPALPPLGTPIRRYIDRLFPSAYAFPTIPKGVFPDAPTNKIRLLTQAARTRERMLLGKYHIVIFKEGKSGSRNLRLRGWLGFAGFLAVGALVACNIWLWRYYHETSLLSAKLSDTEKVVEEQSNQLLSMIGKIRDVGIDLDRVQQFDAKLRLMMNMEKDPAEVGGRGGSRIEDFSTTYLPLHRQELTARKMHAFLKQLSEDVRLEEVRQQDLLRAMRTNRDTLSSLPSIWPIEGFISSSFGGRSSPFSGRGEFHKGLDITSRIGTPIQATAQGTVSFASMDGAYGNSVEINHGGGIVTKYAHMQRFIVKEGQWVRRGDIIGYVGMTGRTTGAHVHYEVRLNGAPINPMRYILN